ncbi:MAG: DUF1080 domain-containing protein [Bryobacteraceae bacterium]
MGKKSALALLIACLPLLAADNTLTAEEKKAGWKLLFDGKSLKGWTDPARKSPPGNAWSIEDGCIKATARPRIREDLLTEESFGDFELVFDWRISPGGNSGVKYRIQDLVFLDERIQHPDSKRFEDRVEYVMVNRVGSREKVGDSSGEEYVVAFEYQVIDDSRHRDAQRGSKYQAGALYDMIGPSKAAARPVGEFNHSRIILRGNRIEHWLNGVKVVDGSLDSEEIREGLAKRWGTQSQVYRLLTTQPKRRTPVGLQNHNDEAWFRNIKIRRLD